MSAKEYLKQIRKIDCIIQQKIQTADSLKRLVLEAAKLKPISYEQEKIQKSPSYCAGFERTILKIVDLEKQINADIDRLIDQKQQIIKQIQSMNQKHFALLYKRYIELKPFKVNEL